MNLLKKSISIFIIILFALLIINCGSEEQEQNSTNNMTLNIKAPKISPALTFARIIENKAFNDNIKVDFTLLSSPTEIPPILQKESADLVFMPLNLAAKLYNKGVNYQLYNVVIWGLLNIVTSDPDINDWKDLKGKELYVFGKGSTPDILTQFLLKKNGLTPGKDIKLIYKQPEQNAQLIIANKIKVAVLPEPVSTLTKLKNEKAKVIIDYNEEWKKLVSDNIELAQAGIMINKDFAENNKETVKKISELYRKEIKYLLNNPEPIAELAVKHKIAANENLIIKSIDKLGLRYKSAEDSMKEVKEYFKVLYNFNPQTIGGKLPDDDFYYTE
ncbi:MAG: ABC transporter substrate-binding protein [Spirochaetota bacterium]